jgi:hypothetical protein
VRVVLQRVVKHFVCDTRPILRLHRLLPREMLQGGGDAFTGAACAALRNDTTEPPP